MFENKEPQDIFEGVEPPNNLPVGDGQAPAVPRPSLPSGVPTPARPTMAAAPGPVPVMTEAPPKSRGHLLRTLIILLIAIVAIVAAGFVAYRALMPNGVTDQSPTGDVQGSNDQNLPDGKGEAPVVETPTTTTVPDAAASVDSDGDGLTNAQELQYGTSVSKPDTDSDGLGDKEEIDVYGTDPLRADTDGDGFFDGQEVRSGYNPNGPGKILEVPTTQ